MPGRKSGSITRIPSLPKIGPSADDVVHIWQLLEWCVSCYNVYVHFRFKLEGHVVALLPYGRLESRTGPPEPSLVSIYHHSSLILLRTSKEWKVFPIFPASGRVSTTILPRRRRRPSKEERSPAAGSVCDYVSKRMRRVLPFRWTLVDSLCRRLHCQQRRRRHHHHQKQQQHSQT